MSQNKPKTGDVKGGQNIYDTADFFDEYIKLDRQVVTWRGLRNLDLGCRMGWFARWAQENGASHVHGVDLSENMLEKARSMTRVDGIEYEKADLDELKLPEGDYDLVFSSLTFHYLVNLPALVKDIQKSLKPKGRFVFSVEHPLFLGPTRGGFITDEEGRKIWPMDAYNREGLRIRNWFVEGVRKQHRTLGTYINILLSAGFELTDFVDWCPTEEEVEKHPGWETEYIRPTFLLMGATRKY
ncbi:S-adenosyl-L-methionine-dependent methyltransferase [Xylariales sp. AK1849]|nr:S-adenosyl-L-methionine-dependent methyltransferase [Xylariales sp. AK1849]